MLRVEELPFNCTENLRLKGEWYVHVHANGAEPCGICSTVCTG